MSDIYEFDFRGKDTDKNNMVCRVAYTLNNDQPVRSTIIGDEPLFYWDYEVEEEDGAFFDEAEIGILEDEIENLRQEIETFDRFSADFAADPDEKFEDFLDNAASITASEPSVVKNDKDALVATLNNSRIAEFYIGFAEEHGVEIVLSKQIRDAEYNRKSGTIFINPNLDHTDQVLVAARELRRHWQHRQGALINPLMFHPDNAVLINRLQVADLAVSMVRIAWELQLAGEKSAWERVENSSLGDLGRAFAREAFLDFRTINNGMAAAAVFETWFLSERCRLEDKTLIRNMLADYQGYVFDQEEAEKSITPTLISALGEMPYGKNYLAQHCATLMGDPIFTDVRDRSNANFLWFIKFERSFREAESELQSQSETLPVDDRLTASHTEHDWDEHDAKETGRTTGDEYNSIQHGAEIVTLYAEHDHEEDADDGENKSLLSKRRGAKQDSSTNNAQGHKRSPENVVYLRRWSGE